MAKTGNELITGIKRRVTVPASQPLLGDSDFLAMADDVIQSRLVPEISAMRQDFFVTSVDQPIVADQDEYPIPYRSIGRTLRDLKRRTDSKSKSDVTLIGVEDEHMAPTNGVVASFFFKGDKYVLRPVPTATTDVMEVWYDIRPSKITTTDMAGLITSFTTDDITVSAVPSDITTGSVVDLIQGVSGNWFTKIDMTVTNVSGNVISFTPGTVPSTLMAAGDWVCSAGKSPVVQLPDECYQYLETETCRRVLNAISDYEGAKALAEEAKVELKNMKLLLEPRALGEATKIVPRRGLARGIRSRWRWGWLR